MPSHSEKALQTIALMNTRAQDWHVADIKWSRELRFVPTRVVCPSCKGRGRIYERRADFSVVCALHEETPLIRAFLIAQGEEAKPWHHSEADRRRWLDAEGICETQCSTCPPRRRARSQGYGMGEVIRLVEREVEVGVIVWPEGCRFDSRFNSTEGVSLSHCELCAKGINKSGRVPVVALGADGRAHGMFVGDDCARKFASFEGFTKDRFLDVNITPDEAVAA